MASVSGSGRRTLEARSGGKMVRARRAAGARTPYERPRFTDSDTPSPNWISKLILSPTRAIASGAGKLISVVFSQDDSDSDSCSDSLSDDYVSEGNVDHDEGDYSSQRADFSKERNEKSETIKYFRKDLEPKTGKRDRICAIEELLIKETFTREECSRLIYIIQSRVVDGLTIADVETQKQTPKPKGTSAEAEEQNLRSIAVMEARKWLSERKLKSSSNSDLDMVVENEVSSPVDMAKSYMRTLPLWASPTFKHGEFTSPSPVGTHLFRDETPYSLGDNSMPSSKLKRKTDTPATGGSWNIQEEIQRVRAKATEDMLSTLPSRKIDWTSFGFEKNPNLHPETIYNNVSEKLDESMEPLDASLQPTTGRFSTHGLPGLETTPAESQNEASLANEANAISEQNQDLQFIHIDDGAGPKSGSEPTVSEDPRPKNALLSEAGVKQLSNSIEGGPQDLRTQDSSQSMLKEATANESTHKDNGLPPLGNSFCTEAVPEQEADLDGEDHYSVSSTSNDVSTDYIKDKTCELLTETDVDVPNLSDGTNEEDHIGNGTLKVSSTNQQSPLRYSTRKGSKRGLGGDHVKRQGNRPSRYRRTKRDISTQ